jgi:hypothetical protein
MLDQLSGHNVNKSVVLFIRQMGAIYVAVIGLDNIYKSLNEQQKLMWDKLFSRR